MLTDKTNQNNLVAKSDYLAAVSAINDYFAPHSSELAKASNASLIKNLDRVVQVVPDQDFQQLVDQYHYVDEEASSCSSEEDDDDDVGVYIYLRFKFV